MLNFEEFWVALASFIRNASIWIVQWTMMINKEIFDNELFSHLEPQFSQYPSSQWAAHLSNFGFQHLQWTVAARYLQQPSSSFLYFSTAETKQLILSTSNYIQTLISSLFIKLDRASYSPWRNFKNWVSLKTRRAQLSWEMMENLTSVWCWNSWSKGTTFEGIF